MPTSDAFSRALRSTISLQRLKCLTALKYIENGRLEVWLEDSAPRSFARFAWRCSTGVHDGAERCGHHVTDVVKLMNTKRLYKRQAVCSMYITRRKRWFCHFLNNKPDPFKRLIAEIRTSYRHLTAPVNQHRKMPNLSHLIFRTTLASMMNLVQSLRKLKVRAMPLCPRHEVRLKTHHPK